MSNDEFLDFKGLVDSEELNWKISTNRNVIKWNHVKEVSILHERPYLIEIKYSLDALDFVTLDILATKKNRETLYEQQHLAPKSQIIGEKFHQTN